MERARGSHFPGCYAVLLRKRAPAAYATPHLYLRSAPCGEQIFGFSFDPAGGMQSISAAVMGCR